MPSLDQPSTYSPDRADDKGQTWRTGSYQRDSISTTQQPDNSSNGRQRFKDRRTQCGKVRNRLCPRRPGTCTKLNETHHLRLRLGHWLPQDSKHHKAWLQQTIKHAQENPKDLHPVLQEFKELVEKNTRLWLLFSNMFEEIPHKQPYQNDPTQQPQVRIFITCSSFSTTS